MWIKNTFAADDFGTLISHTKTENDNNVAVGISNLSKVALLTLEGSGMIGIAWCFGKIISMFEPRKN